MTAYLFANKGRTSHVVDICTNGGALLLCLTNPHSSPSRSPPRAQWLLRNVQVWWNGPGFMEPHVKAEPDDIFNVWNYGDDWYGVDILGGTGWDGWDGWYGWYGDNWYATPACPKAFCVECLIWVVRGRGTLSQRAGKSRLHCIGGFGRGLGHVALKCPVPHPRAHAVGRIPSECVHICERGLGHT